MVDNKDKLLGRVSLKKLIVSDDKVKIADIYDPGELVAVETYIDEEEVAQIMQKYDLEAVPVINLQGKLVGRITIDDVIDVMREIAEQERQLMSGISEDVEEDDSVWVFVESEIALAYDRISRRASGCKIYRYFWWRYFRNSCYCIFYSFDYCYRRQCRYSVFLHRVAKSGKPVGICGAVCEAARKGVFSLLW